MSEDMQLTPSTPTEVKGISSSSEDYGLNTGKSCAAKRLSNIRRQQEVSRGITPTTSSGKRTKGATVSDDIVPLLTSINENLMIMRQTLDNHSILLNRLMQSLPLVYSESPTSPLLDKSIKFSQP